MRHFGRYTGLVFAFCGAGCGLAPVSQSVAILDRPQGQQEAEVIRADFTNLRAAHLLPALDASVGDPQSSVVNGRPLVGISTTPQATSDFFQEEAVSQQLEMLRAHGFNAVEYSFSYYAYLNDPERVVSQASFVFSEAARLGIYLIPTLFRFGGPPPDPKFVGYEAPRGRDYWGETQDPWSFEMTEGFRTVEHGGCEYIQALHDAALANGNPVLLWNISGGVRLYDATEVHLAAEFAFYARYIKLLNGLNRVMVGLTTLVDDSNSFGAFITLAREPAIDVFGITTTTVFAATRYDDIELTLETLSREGYPHQQVITYRMGSFQELASYARMIDFVQTIDNRSPAFQEGTGFVLTSVVTPVPDIFTNRFHSPYYGTEDLRAYQDDSYGMLYPDGSARDAEGLSRLHALAARHGYPARAEIEPSLPSSANFVPRSIIASMTYEEAIDLVLDWENTRPRFGDGAVLDGPLGYGFQYQLLSMFSYAVGRLAGGLFGLYPARAGAMSERDWNLLNDAWIFVLNMDPDNSVESLIAIRAFTESGAPSLSTYDLVFDFWGEEIRKFLVDTGIR